MEIEEAPPSRPLKSILKEKPVPKITSIKKHSLTGKSLAYEALYDNGSKTTIYSVKDQESAIKDKIIGYLEAQVILFSLKKSDKEREKTQVADSSEEEPVQKPNKEPKKEVKREPERIKPRKE